MRVLLVTSLYPTAAHPERGRFVADQVESSGKIDLNDFANLFLFGTQFFAGAEIGFLFLKRIAIRGYLSLDAKPFNE